MIHSKPHLTLLATLADGHSISEAARQMGIPQPQASKMLKGMEAQTGLALVLRRGPSVTPTEELHMLAKQARKILANMRTMDEMVERIKRREEVEG